MKRTLNLRVKKNIYIDTYDVAKYKHRILFPELIPCNRVVQRAQLELSQKKKERKKERKKKKEEKTNVKH